MHLREIYPSPALSQFIRLYRIIDFEFQHSLPIPPKAYSPRPEQCLQFFPCPTLIEYQGRKVKPKNALLIGQHTIVNQRTVFKKFLSLQVVFQPDALHRLLGLSLEELTNESIEAELVLGSEVESVNDQLYHSRDHRHMIQIVESFLSKLFGNTLYDPLPIDRMTRLMLEPTQHLDWYVSNACLSHRQFDRKFIQRAGISPKEYLRVVRFDQAYRMKNAYPEMSWFNIAVACGYYDYQHLSKETKAFTGQTPSSFFSMGSPERLLGTEEVY
ncbi:helix-turn-helix domain-containing protein [Pedobacter paludis]|uniref:AraC family transcriptional regulator n=1 Tax=Pedobacter paludis TaxID=2203212 RepID=A0A317EWN0_9SPHI|nr:helix-turn-helix domain-containing protein [Pedobacter paludis]PWS30257.1 AraC family transcriptional regulator [Pedobacter paludis]